MKIKALLFLLTSSSLSLFAFEPYHEIATGYYGDAGITFALRLEEESKRSPFFIQARGGYIYQTDSGNATDARAIFINDNSGGNVEKYGESYLAALDLGWKWKSLEKMSVELTLSGLWNYYLAHYSFIGDNEAFTVTTKPFGIGVGAALRMPLSNSRSSLMLKGGAEYFPKAQLNAHGTYYYTPSGEDDKPRDGYSYDDADEAVNQPRFRPYLLIGYLYAIGR
ncbi:MAG: hypothetical protein PQJ59_03900 [Spirochaetales bacterium]|nr:hypothetical protein [Spirochaetales bacterium]